MTEASETPLTERSDFRDFVTNLDNVVVWSGTESGFDYVSPAFEEVYGRTVDELLEDMSVVLDAVHPEDRDRVAAVMEDRDERLQRGETIRAEHRVVHPDGTVRWVEVRIFPVRDSSGEPTEVVGVTIDITDRKRAELELEHQNERLDQFARVVSHDLRNPLTTAKGYLELLKAEVNHRYLEYIDEGLIRIEEIVEDVLTLTRAENASETTERVDLGAEAQRAWTMTETGSATLRLSNDLGTIVADGSLVRQLLENVFGNAAKHGGRDVTVSVRALPDGFSVDDDGVGIPEDDRDRVFEAGYSTSQGGTGLGLLIVHEIAEAHGWDVRITDSEEGGVRLEITGVETAE
ncbi:sensor histidine kinase [Natrarchaeobius sp. A-rgal3]|uniref:sensor histidine kinase n=1 Tax=Natrarchaeobius versutus TaxID=1679078 RepID=UPI003510BFA4